MIVSLGKWLRFGKESQSKHPSGCLSCGRCCELFGGHLHASKADLQRWRREGRQDLLDRVNRLGWIWVDPDSGALLKRCPFLTRTGPETQICAIHAIKPDICRAYPTLAHARRCLRGVFLGLVAVLLDLSPLLSPVIN